MENTTYNTEETLKFINLMFNKQIEDKTLCLKNGKTNKYDIIQKDYVYKSFSVIQAIVKCRFCGTHKCEPYNILQGMDLSIPKPGFYNYLLL